MSRRTDREFSRNRIAAMQDHQAQRQAVESAQERVLSQVQRPQPFRRDPSSAFSPEARTPLTNLEFLGLRLMEAAIKADGLKALSVRTAADCINVARALVNEAAQ